MPLDVSTPDQSIFDSTIQSALDRFGRIDVVVNNAGHGILVHFEETDETQVRDIFETNVFGLMRMTRSALPVFRRQGTGHIVNISSMAGYVGGNATYSATKFAVTGFTESLAVELAPFGISVTNVAPGYFRTDFLDQSSAPQSPAKPIADYEQARSAMRDFATQMNHNQAGDPTALGRLIVDITDCDDPPLHLLVGEDAISEVEGRNHRVTSDIAIWRERSVATALAPT